MPAQGNFKKGTNQFMRQGHTTADVYGSNINAEPIGKANQAPKEVKP